MSDTPQVLLQHHLGTLRLPTFNSEYAKLARQCAAEGRDHVQYFLRLCELELIERERRMIERRIKAAKFPATRSLDSFDFRAIPSLNKALTTELARCEFADRRENVIALPQGTPNSDQHGRQKGGRGRLISRTKGGMNTKLHAICDSHGRPINFFVTAGQVSDHIGARALLSSLPNVEWLPGDRGYDADRFRDALGDKGIRACIPGRKQRKTSVKYDKRR